MPSKIILSLVHESLTGDVGSEWEYLVKADLMDPELYGSGSIAVPLHVLRSGTTQEPPNAGRAVMLEGGECGQEVSVRLTLEATDVVWMDDDRGSHHLTIGVKTPVPGGAPIGIEPVIEARVQKAQGYHGGAALLKIKVRLVARCEK